MTAERKPVDAHFERDGVTISNPEPRPYAVLQPIVWAGGPTAPRRKPIGIDLYTAAPGPVGWDGFESYADTATPTGPGYQTSPTGAAAAVPSQPSKSYRTTPHEFSGGRDWRRRSRDLCTLTVTDGLTQQHNASPTFVVTTRRGPADTNVNPAISFAGIA